ncbi:MAG TPA: DUF4249 family protein [Gemmatimonadaceae bacterium]|nr:DUF4249 family protein [Gemmatimonadaceae bacterium]
MLVSLGASMLAVALAGCDIGKVTLAETTPSLVIHSVLSVSATSQIVLLERTLTGAVTLPDTQFDPTDPIVSAGGIPVVGALVELIDSAGTVVQGTEDLTPSSGGKGAGSYHIPLSGASLRRGERYELHVHTLEGEDATAFTRVPNPEVTSSGALSRTFNRDHDTLAVAWNATPGARSYAVRVESPFGPFFFFTDSLGIRLSGELRNPFAADLQHLFIPGFRQDVVISAVDSNFYDYYRTNNDPFTGSGIISRIQGGIGLFGAVVNLNSGTLNVTADQTEPIEGRFRLVSISGTGGASPARQFTIYVESPAARDGLPAALSGRYAGITSGGDGMIGQQLGNTITLALLRNQLAGDTLDLFAGVLRGDTLSGTYRSQGLEVVFVRQ